MLTTSAAPRPARAEPSVAPRRPASPGAPLRVVTGDELREARRRARARRLVALTVCLVALGLFGVVIAHVMLMQGQFELQRLQQQSSTSQAEYDRLRLQVSELESPDRIVAVAHEKLGMVAPPTITYLAPSNDPAAAPGGGREREAPAGVAEVGSPASWSSVKSHLAGG